MGTETPTGDNIKTEVKIEVLPKAELKLEPKLETVTNVNLIPIHTRHIYKEVHRILHWKEPIETGLIFGIINFTVYLLTCGGYSIITLTSYALLSLLLVGGAYVYGTQLKVRFGGGNYQNPLVERFKNSSLKISKENLEEIVDIIVEFVNHLEEKFRAIFLHTNPYQTLKYAAIIYAISIVGKIFSFVTLFEIALWITFIWPKVYSIYHKEIHHYYGVAKGHANTHIENALSKIPPVGPLAQIVKQKKTE